MEAMLDQNNMKQLHEKFNYFQWNTSSHAEFTVFKLFLNSEICNVGQELDN